MKTYPNQKIITINKAKTDKQNTYATINKECLMKAVTELTHNELKIYLYLASNQNGYQLALSSADVAEKTNASKRKIQEAINSLIEKGYLVETGTNSYDFIEDTVYKKDIVYEKDTVMCTKSTQVCVQKVHMDVYKKDTEIVQDNTINNTTDSTSAKAPLSDCSLSESIQNKIKSEWKVQNDDLEGSNSDDGRFKNEEWKVHNEPIIDNRKDNVKDNRIENAVAIEAMDINGYCLESNGQNSTKAIDKNEESNGQNSTEAMDAGVQIIDNRKDNIKDNRIDKAVAVSESKNRISESLINKIKSIGIDVKQNTINAIVEATGDSCSINEEAISNIIDMCLEEGMFHGNSGYRFAILRNQIAANYNEVVEYIDKRKEEEAEKKRRQEEINKEIEAAQPEINKNREQLTALCSILFPEREVDDRMLTCVCKRIDKIKDVDAFIEYHKKNPSVSIKCNGFQQTYNTIKSVSDEYVNPIDYYITYVQDMMRYEQSIGA